MTATIGIHKPEQYDGFHCDCWSYTFEEPCCYCDCVADDDDNKCPGPK